MIKTCLAALILGLLGAAQDADAWKRLEGDDAPERQAAFEALRASADPAVQARLRKTVQTQAATALRKAQAERARAARALAAASRRGWNPLEIQAKQKELQAMLAAGNTKGMEAPAKELWARFFFDPAKADADEKAAAARARAEELAGWQAALGVPDAGVALKSSLRAADEAACFLVLEKRDQKIMSENAALREKIPALEYEQAWLTNQYRIVFGRTPLRLDVRLFDAAREHCKDMKEHDFFAHESPLPGKRTPGDRAARHGTSAGGENIYKGSPKPEDSFWAWFHSLGHHQNMVRDYATLGVGTFEKHWTQMFG
jgi:hypothetical protein